MNEVHRLEYLDAMGIDSYMPRVMLPNAPLSVVCEPVMLLKSGVGNRLAESKLEQPSVAISVAAQVATKDLGSVVESNVAVKDIAAKEVDSGGPERVGGAAALLSVMDGGVARPQTAKPEGSLAPFGGSAEKMGAESIPIVDPRFSLSCWRVSDDLLIIDSRHSELALPTEALLNNILRALGGDTMTVPRAEVLSWPMYDDPSAPKHEEAARETIGAMLGGMLEARPAKFCLLMGGNATHFVLPVELSSPGADQRVTPKEQRYSDCLGKSFSLGEFGVTAIVVPGLSDMLQTPSLKAVTWKAIQPLRVR